MYGPVPPKTRAPREREAQNGSPQDAPRGALLDAIGPYTALRAIPDVEVRFVSYKAGPSPDDSTQLILSATHTFDETPNPTVIVVPSFGIAMDAAIADTALIEWSERVCDHVRRSLTGTRNVLTENRQNTMSEIDRGSLDRHH